MRAEDGLRALDQAADGFALDRAHAHLSGEREPHVGALALPPGLERPAEDDRVVCEGGELARCQADPAYAHVAAGGGVAEQPAHGRRDPAGLERSEVAQFRRKHPVDAAIGRGDGPLDDAEQLGQARHADRVALGSGGIDSRDVGADVAGEVGEEREDAAAQARVEAHDGDVSTDQRVSEVLGDAGHASPPVRSRLLLWRRDFMPL